MRASFPQALLLTGMPFHGQLRADAYTGRGWQLRTGADEAAKWLANTETDLGILLSACGDENMGPLGDTVVFVDGTELIALLPGRFFSGFWPLNQTITEQKLESDPLPQVAAVRRLADRLEAEAGA